MASASRRATLNEVLCDEVRALRGPSALKGFVPVPFPGQEPASKAEEDAQKAERAANLRDLYDRIGKLEAAAGGAPPPENALSALCLSGGGIRSATFNLGVIQQLARLGLLGRFDYLSSVSGGGYIASWLSAWIRRETAPAVVKQLEGTKLPENPLVPEPRPIDRLREYSNYLTPRRGMFSPDTWTAAALILRNILLNWLVIVPFLGFVVTVPQFVMLVTIRKPDVFWAHVVFWISLLVALVASVTTHWFRRLVKDPETPQGRFVRWCVLPVCLAATLLSTAAPGLDLPGTQGRPGTSEDRNALILFAALWCIAIPVTGWAVSEVASRLKGETGNSKVKQASPFFEFLALVLSGGTAGVILFAVLTAWLPFLHAHPAFYAILAFPTLLAIYLIARTLFVAFASLSEGVGGEVKLNYSDDADREWWARLSGWVLLAAVGWLVFGGVCILAQPAFQWLGGYARGAVAGMGGASGLLAAWLGSKGDPSGAEVPKGRGARLEGLVIALAAPLFIVSVLLLISLGTVRLGDLAMGHEGFLRLPLDLRRTADGPNLEQLLRFLLVPAGLFLLAFATGRIVNVNRFSLHGLYRNRLVRAYLGASNNQRKPDPFTGFDPNDNIPLYELAGQRPLPLINTTLNLVSGEKLAWQQRKAESFSMTPHYCGNFYEGYRVSREYGGPSGISLGTAFAVSGAAANPNMGSSSSAVIGFLLALFNLRLGAWLGNTNRRGDETHRLPGPRQALFPLLAELFGLTSAKSKYVNLSDGGHFDNLGLYEPVLRRCRYIVVSDAGQDPRFAFEDLGNAIRKIRIDFGIPIDFKQKIAILPRSASETGLYCATADIRYSAVDGPVPDGHLLYIKPTLRGERADQPVPYDVYSYAQKADLFPHESTADQWFSESQFESYRALGFHALASISGGAAGASGFREFLARVDKYMAPLPPP
jgi:patatin-like phospholipase